MAESGLEARLARPGGIEARFHQAVDQLLRQFGVDHVAGHLIGRLGARIAVFQRRVHLPAGEDGERRHGVHQQVLVLVVADDQDHIRRPRGEPVAQLGDGGIAALGMGAHGFRSQLGLYSRFGMERALDPCRQFRPFVRGRKQLGAMGHGDTA